MNPKGFAARTLYIVAGFICAMLIEIACPGLHPIDLEGAQITHPRAHLTVSGVLTVVELRDEIASPGFISAPTTRIRHVYDVNTMRFEPKPGSDLEKFLKAKAGTKVAILIGPAE